MQTVTVDTSNSNSNFNKSIISTVNSTRIVLDFPNRSRVSLISISTVLEDFFIVHCTHTYVTLYLFAWFYCLSEYENQPKQAMLSTPSKASKRVHWRNCSTVSTLFATSNFGYNNMEKPTSQNFEDFWYDVGHTEASAIYFVTGTIYQVSNRAHSESYSLFAFFILVNFRNKFYFCICNTNASGKRIMAIIAILTSNDSHDRLKKVLYQTSQSGTMTILKRLISPVVDKVEIPTLLLLQSKVYTREKKCSLRSCAHFACVFKGAHLEVPIEWHSSTWSMYLMITVHSEKLIVSMRQLSVVVSVYKYQGNYFP